MSEFVNVPVPADRVMEVYALLATGTGSTTASGREGDTDLSPDWTENDIRVAYSESSTELQRFFQILSKQPRTWVRSDEAYPELEYTSNQFAGAMGAFGRRVRSRYKKSTWFFEYKEDPVSGLTLYRMDEHVSVIIQRESTT